MATILKQTCTQRGEIYTNEELTIKVIVDGSITNQEINNYLPNNGARYDNKVKYIESGSTCKILTTDAMILGVFIAEVGIKNTKTGFKEGKWNVISSIPFLS